MHEITKKISSTIFSLFCLSKQKCFAFFVEIHVSNGNYESTEQTKHSEREIVKETVKLIGCGNPCRSPRTMPADVP